MRIIRAAGFLSIALTISLSVADAAMLHVPSAYPTIQAAIDAAAPGDSVVLAPGIYRGAGNRDIDFKGKPITVQSNAPADHAVVVTTVIDCQRLGRGFIFQRAETSAATLDGITIANGSITSDGGAIRCTSTATPTVRNCIFRNNTATGGGGAISIASPGATILNCRFLGNSAASGGALLILNSSPVLLNCAITNNRASTSGGGIYVSGTASKPLLTHCTISSNTATSSGGGIRSESAIPTLTNCIVWGNTPQAMAVNNSAPVVAFCDVQGGWTGNANLNIDPLLALPDDPALLPDSACVDAGTPAPPGGLPASDIGGQLRAQDGNNDGQAVPDLGAYELAPGAARIALAPMNLEYLRSAWIVNPPAQSFRFRNCGFGLLSWHAAATEPWMVLSSTSGTSHGETVQIDVSVNTAGLAPGEYTGIIHVTDTQAVAPPRAVLVQLRVARSIPVPSAYPTIQAAIDAAADGDEVVLAPGVYLGAGNRDVDFKGKMIHVRSTAPDDWAVVGATIVDCRRAGRGFVFQKAECSGTALEGLTIRDGAANQGGAISCSNGAGPTIRRCVFRGNLADSSSSGGAILHSSSGACIIKDCVFANNGSGTGGASGAGIAVWSGSATIEDCLFVGNQGTAGAGVWTANNVTGLKVSNCTFLNNSVASSGGAISAMCPNTSISASRFIGNAASNGGAIAIGGSGTSITNCAIRGNRATSYGGGMYMSSAASNAVISHCTLTGNTATTGGAGLRCDGVTPAVTNCIIWGNGAQGISVNGAGPTVTYCDVEGGWAGIGNMNADPLLALAADLHLLPGSPCIDAGTPAPPGGLPATDLEGKGRLIDGNGDNSPVPDLGAYEFAPAQPCIALEPLVLSYSRPVGAADPQDQSFSIRNCGAGTLSWQAVAASPWIELLPGSGSSTGEIVPVMVRVHTDGLAEGDHIGTILVQDTQAANTPRLVYVLLHVGRTLRVPGEYPGIRIACEVSQSGDWVLVADGIYRGSNNRNMNPAGKAITVRSENGPEHCIIDCESQSSSGVFTIWTKEGADTIIDGLTFKDTYYSSGIGGGVFRCSGSSPTIRNCRFICTIKPDLQPAISCQNAASPRISNCFIQGLKPHSNVSSGGAGIYCENSAPIISDCVITELESGAAVRAAQNSQVQVLNCRFSRNRNASVYCDSSTITLIQTRIEDNLERGIIATSGTLNLVGCSIRRNKGPDYGGGIQLSEPSTVSSVVLNATNTIIADNEALYGGGIYAYQHLSGGLINLVNCTIAYNRAVLGYRGASPFAEGSVGGAITTYSGNLTLSNCIVWGNTARTGTSICFNTSSYLPENAARFYHSNIEGGQAGLTIVDGSQPLSLTWDDGNINQPPQFAFADDFHLLANSPCIDAGTNTPPGGLPDTDADGNARSMDGKSTGSAVADMGTYEFNPQAASIAVSPPIVHFQAFQGIAGPPDQRLGIRNAGGGILNWSISSSCDWLQVQPAAGQSAGEVDEVTLHVDVSSISPSSPSCTLTITDPQAVNSPLRVEVRLTYNSVLHVPDQYATIQAAIDAVSQDGDLVVVGDGIWKGAGNRNLNSQYLSMTVRSANGPDHCIIDCQGSGSAFVLSSGNRVSNTVEGFTITKGSDSGIKVRNGKPTIRNCRIIGNAGVNGGGVFADYGAPVLLDCLISGNTATTDGGGVYAGTYADFTELTGCVISDNTALHHGGGWCIRADVVLNGSTFTGNSALGNGGGVYLEIGGSIKGDVPCTVINNRAVLGGGLYFDSVSPTITGWTIANNTAFDRGGGIATSKSAMSLKNCLVYSNHAEHRGGGLFAQYPFTYGSLMLENCSFSQNSANDAGGAVYFWQNPTSDAILFKNTILWGDASPVGTEIALTTEDKFMIMLHTSYCDVQGGAAGVFIESGGQISWTPGNIAADPLFLDPVHDNFRLMANSPGIDAGDPASDFAREPQPNGGRINMGAFGNTAEAESKSSLLVTVDQLIRESHINAGVFEYEFTLRAYNLGAQDAADVVAELAQIPEGVEVIQPTVDVGTVAAGATVISHTSCIIRVDRRQLISVLPITWRLTDSGGSPRRQAGSLVLNPVVSIGDLDNDSDVDVADLSAFSSCLTGPAIPYQPDQLPAGCNSAVQEGHLGVDFDRDGDVDQVDFGMMQSCMNGPGTPGNCH